MKVQAGLALFYGQHTKKGMEKKKKAGSFAGAGLWAVLTDQDSNLNRQNQNLQCYRYTIGQYLFDSGCKDKTIFFSGNYFFRILIKIITCSQAIR